MYTMRTCLLTCKNFFLLIQLLCFANHVNAQEITWNVSTYNGYNVSCHGASDGWINIVVVDGTPPYLYNWSNGSFSKNQTNLEAGIYTVIVTDANQNTISAEIELQQPNALEVSLIPEIREGGYNISENGGNDGVIGTEVQGGVLPYTYLWSNNTTSNKISNGVAGNYSLVLTDMNGCTAGGSATLTQPTELQIVSISSPLQNGYNIACFDAKNGSIDLTVTGGVPPYEYQWSNGAFTEDIGELEPGSYWVIVRDANGAGDAAQIVLTGPSALEASFSISSYPNGKNVSCYACSNGSVSTTVNGGAAPFTFQWEHGATSANLTNLGVGSYNLILTDANGCRLEARAEILGPDRDDWTMSGNAGTDPSNQFIGTTDNKDIVFKTNSTERMRLKASGSVNFPGLAGTGSRILQVSQNGDMEVGPIILNDLFTGICGNLPITNPFLRTNIDGPWNAKDVINCSQRFGFGVLTPQERIDVSGFARFNGANGSYLNIGNDGNSKLNSFGSGELLINSESIQNVKICTEPNGGFVEVGGKTILATLRDNVGIRTTTPDVDYALDVNGPIKATALTLNGDPMVNYWTDGGGGSIYTGKRIGINRSGAPNDDLEIGDAFTLHGGPANKWIGYNNFYNSTALENKRINPGFASRMNFGDDGTIIFKTADYDGTAGSTITFKDAMTILNDGKVGIGINPSYQLHVNGDAEFLAGGNTTNGFQIVSNKIPTRRGIRLDPNPAGNFDFYIHKWQDEESFNFLANNETAGTIDNLMSINGNGQIAMGGINYVPTGYVLGVHGKMIATEVVVRTEMNWPDFVFQKDYKLRSLKELNEYISENRHLPDVPTAEEIENSGISVGAILTKQMQKIEELTLYVLELQKQIDELKIK